MDPKLRDLIDHKKLCQGLVAEIGQLVPADDAELDALVAETVAGHDAQGFLFVVLAALTKGRPVDSRHLMGGVPLLGHVDWLCCIAWKMRGDVAENLVAALHKTVMTREQHATALLIATAWSIEFREGKQPQDLIKQARVMARSTEGNVTQINCLWAIIEMLKDPDLSAVMRAAHPRLCSPKTVEIAVAFGEAALAVCRKDLALLIPQKPDNLIGSGPRVRRAVPRIGRNDPCHCGSGQKYKRCCADKDQERMRQSSHVEGKTRAEVMADLEVHLTEPMLKKMAAHAVARLDVAKVPARLLPAYFRALDAGLLLEEAASAFEKLGCDTEEMKAAWDLLIQTVGMKQRLEVARRMVKVRYKGVPVPDTLQFRIRLLLASEEPERCLKLIETEARTALTSDNEHVLMEFAYALLFSKNVALGIHCARSLIPAIGKKLASQLLHLVEVARDQLNLPPDEPFGEILEKRFAEEVADGGRDAEELRKARQRVETKAAEVGQLKESLEKLRREIRLQERKMPAVAPTQTHVESSELKELREKVRALKSSISERNNERAAFRRELGEAYAELEALRARQAAAAPAPTVDATDEEDELLLPGDIDSNQSPRPIEFPRRFHDTLQHLPRQTGRAALVLIGRIAAGDPTAFSGAIRLKIAPDVMRVRVGLDHRMLFRLLPESVQVVDLINRRDLERCIASL